MMPLERGLPQSEAGVLEAGACMHHLVGVEIGGGGQEQSAGEADEENERDRDGSSVATQWAEEVFGSRRLPLNLNPAGRGPRRCPTSAVCALSRQRKYRQRGQLSR